MSSNFYPNPLQSRVWAVFSCKSVRGYAPIWDQWPGAMGEMRGLSGVRTPFQIHLCNILGFPDQSSFPLYDGARPRGFLTGCYFRRLLVGQAPEQEVRMKQASWEHLLCDRELLLFRRNWTSAAAGGI